MSPAEELIYGVVSGFGFLAFFAGAMSLAFWLRFDIPIWMVL
jgi:hypothetical protein